MAEVLLGVVAEVQPLLLAVQHPVSVEEEREWEVVAAVVLQVVPQ